MLTQLPMSGIAEIAFPPLPDANASARLAQQYQLDKSQWWTPAALLEHQVRQLQPLLEHAAASVPYYRELFSASGVSIPARLTAQFLQRIPVSTRHAVQAAGDELCSRRPPAAHGAPQFAATSGSTGRPVKFARTAVTHAFWLAFALRDHLWHARDFSAKLGAIRWFPRGTAEAPDGVHHPTWGEIVDPVFASGPSASLNVLATLQEQVDWLARERPACLVSFPSNLVALAQYAAAQGASLPALNEVRTIGETVTERTRRLIEQAWRAKVTDVYTCEEAGYLALQCPASGNYHVQAENVLLEIVDDAGKPCAPGQTGQVLITALHNYATPLIRYEVGDLAEFGAPCPCGRGLPVIRSIHGRKRNRLRLPSGDSIFPYLGEHGGITALTGVRLHQFQCIQHSLDDIELKLVMERPLTDAEQEKVAALMQRNLGHPFRIALSFHADLPRGPSGKFEEFISEVA